MGCCCGSLNNAEGSRSTPWNMEPPATYRCMMKGWLDKKGKFNTAMKARYFVLATEEEAVGTLIYFEAPWKARDHTI